MAVAKTKTKNKVRIVFMLPYFSGKGNKKSEKRTYFSLFFVTLPPDNHKILKL
jgi:hypothetical protein